MTFEQLRTFVAVAEALNMTRAAKVLHRTQPSVSAGIAALEDRYGARLFHRVGRGLELSEPGLAFLPQARQVLAEVERAQALLSDSGSRISGRLSIFASQTVATYWLPTRLVRFANAYPSVEVALTVGNTAQAAAAVIDGLAEIGFVEGPVHETILDQAGLGVDRAAVYASPDHPLAFRTATRDDLLSAAWVLREQGSGTREHLAKGLESQDIQLEDLDIRLELPSNGAVLEAVQSGEVITGISELAAQARLCAGLLAPVTFPLPPRTFRAITHRERSHGSAARALFMQLGL